MKIIGIDPGNSGAICVLSNGLISFVKLDCTERDVADFLFPYGQSSERECFAYLEKVHSMPRQGVSSSFKFGVSYGFLRGLLIGFAIPFDDVTPQRWMKAMNCMTGGDKNVTKARAQQLFPKTKITHAIADAALIAEFGRRLRNGELS